MNLIPYNPTGMYEGSSRKAIGAFKDVLDRARVPVTVRLTRGRELLAGVNDSAERAKALAALLDPKVFKVNLIPYNPTGMYDGSSRDTIAAFKSVLDRARLPADGAPHPWPRHRRRVRPAGCDPLTGRPVGVSGCRSNAPPGRHSRE